MIVTKIVMVFSNAMLESRIIILSYILLSYKFRHDLIT